MGLIANIWGTLFLHRNWRHNMNIKSADLHHLHVWSAGEGDIHLEAHVNVNNMLVSEGDALRESIEKKLEKETGIGHITLQFECNQCPQTGLIGDQH